MIIIIWYIEYIKYLLFLWDVNNYDCPFLRIIILHYIYRVNGNP